MDFCEHIRMRPSFRAAIVACAALVGACDTAGPARPEPGDLTVTLSTPNATDHAMVLNVTGPEAPTAVEAATPDYVVHSRITGTTARVAVFGLLASGPVVRVSVPDVRRAREYTVTVQEAVDAGNTPRPTLAGYAATVKR